MCTVFKNLNVGTVRVFNLNEVNTEPLEFFIIWQPLILS